MSAGTAASCSREVISLVKTLASITMPRQYSGRAVSAMADSFCRISVRRYAVTVSAQRVKAVVHMHFAHPLHLGLWVIAISHMPPVQLFLQPTCPRPVLPPLHANSVRHALWGR
eukprot:5494585-Amphidinium_carterae.1